MPKMKNNATVAMVPNPTPILAAVPKLVPDFAFSDISMADAVAETDEVAEADASVAEIDVVEDVVGVNVTIDVDTCVVVLADCVVVLADCVVVLADCVVVLGINELVVVL